MSDFFSKIENFIFDILGLILPGIIFSLILISPIYFLDLSKVPQQVIDNSFILSGMATFIPVLLKQFAKNTNLTITIMIIFAYLLGHLVKVFSIILYEIMVAIFDNFLNKIANLIYTLFKSLLNKLIFWIFGKELSKSTIYANFKKLFSPLKSILNKIFVFDPPYYFKDNDQLRTYCINIINAKLETTYPDKWYSLYKLSKILNSQEDIKSLSDFFLAKYNLYRSLAFIFIFTTFYFHYFFLESAPYISPELSKMNSLIFITSCLLSFTFHYKYKRYWTLCGNETLVSLYYFLNKKKLNEA